MYAVCLSSGWLGAAAVFVRLCGYLYIFKVFRPISHRYDLLQRTT